MNNILSRFFFVNNANIYRMTSLSLMLFALSLPFNAIEWKIFGVNRFEMKITMLTFSLLFVFWLIRNFATACSRNRREILFLVLAVTYSVSQFASLINSPYPTDSLKQGLIILSLMVMMFVVSESVLDRDIGERVMGAIGGLSIFIGFVSVITYYFANHDLGRLGQTGVASVGPLDIGGDPCYFGDILLFSIGAVFFVLIKLKDQKHCKYLLPILLTFWLSATVLTFTKGLVIAISSFILCAIILMKGNRRFLLACTVLFIMTLIFIPQVNKAVPAVRELFLAKKVSVTGGTDPAPVEKEKKNIWDARAPLIHKRFDMHHPLNTHSWLIRKKAIEVSLENTMPFIFFGRGAGLSQRLLPGMANEHDSKVDQRSAKFEEMIRHNTYGKEVNQSVVDSHILFVTEFFNVGIAGALSLIGLIGFVMLTQIRIIKSSPDDRVRDINALLLSTVISMIVYRFSASLIVIPFLWFILGLSFGISKLSWRQGSHTVTSPTLE
jgi:hypothetical protein